MDVEQAVKETIAELHTHVTVDKDGKPYRLREYQIDFLETVVTKYDHVGTFDEMGVGKTMQLIALDHVRRKQAGEGRHRTLVVAPLTGVVDQWVDAFNDWCPWLTIKRINTKNAKARVDSIEIWCW